MLNCLRCNSKRYVVLDAQRSNALTSKQEENCVAQSLFDKETRYILLREKVLKTPYVSRLLPLHQWIKSNC